MGSFGSSRRKLRYPLLSSSLKVFARDDVCNVRRSVRACLQHLVLLLGIHDVHNIVPVDARAGCEESVPECVDHLGHGTFIAAYHYLRIFNSWVEAYEYKPNTSGEVEDPVLTGVPFNDAYRYMDWLLTVPLLLIEIVFVMKLSDEETKKKATTLV